MKIMHNVMLAQYLKSTMVNCHTFTHRINVPKLNFTQIIKKKSSMQKIADMWHYLKNLFAY